MAVANVPIAEKIYQRQITKLGLSNSRFPLLVMRSEVDLDRSFDWRCEDAGNTFTQPIPF